MLHFYITLIDLSEGPSPETNALDGADLLPGAATSVCMAEFTEKDMQGYAKLLLAGRKKVRVNSLSLSQFVGLCLSLSFLVSLLTVPLSIYIRNI